MIEAAARSLESVARFFSPRKSTPTPSVADLLTPLPEALSELARRREDPQLAAAVRRYLHDDLPEYFGDKAVLYLARHIASPNFETLRFLHLVESDQLEVVIGQDPTDLFVSRNAFKKSLCKLPICVRLSYKDGAVHEQLRHETIVDFSGAECRPLRDIRTIWGEPLTEFHNSLFETFAKAPVRIEDDSAWIDRNGRGDLLRHYKRFLALFLRDGILFEDYQVEDKEEGRFVERILRPAYLHVARALKVKPLIVQLTPTSLESSRFWESYPKEVLDIVRARIAASHDADPVSGS